MENPRDKKHPNSFHLLLLMIIILIIMIIMVIIMIIMIIIIIILFDGKPAGEETPKEYPHIVL